MKSTLAKVYEAPAPKQDTKTPVLVDIKLDAVIPTQYTQKFDLPTLSFGVRVKPFKIKVTRIPITHLLPAFHDAISTAGMEYNLQPEARKSLPINRFWTTPNTLQEHCVQLLIQEGIRKWNSFQYFDLIPSDLKECIEKLIDMFLKGIEVEKSADRLIPRFPSEPSSLGQQPN